MSANASCFRVRLVAGLAATLWGAQLAWLFLLRGARILEHTTILVSGQVVLGAVVVALAMIARSTSARSRSSRRRSEMIIVIGAAALHLTALMLLRPALSEDVLRYRHDARMWLAGESPYATAAQDWTGDSIDQMTAHSHLPTIYPPVSQVFFTLAGTAERFVPGEYDHPGEKHWMTYQRESHDPYRAATFRAIFAAAALVAVVVLLVSARRLNYSPWIVTIFAWNPLVILEVSGMGHQDILGVALLLMAIEMTARSRFHGGAATLAVAGAVKPFPLLLAPLLLRQAHRGDGSVAKTLLVLAIMLVALYAPAMLYQGGLDGWQQSIIAYSVHWEANGSVYEVIKWIGGEDDGAVARAKTVARVLALAVVIVCVAIAWVRRAPIGQAGYWVFLAGLLCSPVVYPWYLLWVLCLVPLMRTGGWAVLIWSATAVFSYIDEQPWAAVAQYGVVYAAVAVELARMTVAGRADRISGRCDPVSEALVPRT